MVPIVGMSGQATFEATVESIETWARRRPEIYRLCVIGWAALGYLYLFAVVGALALVSLFLIVASFVWSGAAIVTPKLLVITVPLLVMSIRALHVPLPPPRGMRLERSAVPALFAMIDDTLRILRAPRLSQVLVTSECNASVLQHRRFRLFPGKARSLCIGLPLLQGFGVDEFRFVLAHEFAHLSRGDDRLGAWIYRVRISISQLVAALEARRHWGHWLYLPFLRWYSPRFAAWSLVMARQQEIKADRVAAEFTSPQIGVAALLRMEVTKAWLAQQFWPSIFGEIETRAEPSEAPFAKLAGTVPVACRAIEDASWLRKALARRHAPADTHPSLADRLAELGSEACDLVPVTLTAADALLGDYQGRITAQLDITWQNDVGPEWRNRHAVLTARTTRRIDLETQLNERGLTTAEKFELALLIRDIKDLDRAEAMLRDVLTAEPLHAGAHAELGALLVGRDNAAAIVALEEAIRLDPRRIIPSGEVLAPILDQLGRKQEAHEMRGRIAVARAELAEDAREMTIVRPSDDFDIWPIDPAQRMQLAKALAARCQDVRRAWLIAKLRADGRVLGPFLVVQRSLVGRLLRRQPQATVLARSLATSLPIPPGTTVVVTRWWSRWLRRRARRIKGSLIRLSGRERL